MKTPSLEEVKEYFKNAKEVKALTTDRKIINYQELKDTLYYDIRAFWLKDDAGNQIIVNVRDNCVEYGEIISYIEPTYTLTKEQLTYLHSVDAVKETIEEWFPSEFPKLEVGKWYWRDEELLVWNDGNNTCGFNSDGDYRNYLCCSVITNPILATPQEVEEALTKEIEKRYPIGSVIKSLDNNSKHTVNDKSCGVYNEKYNYVCFAGAQVFSNGIWAEIISKPIELTLDEARDKLAKLEGVDKSQIKIIL